jgi:hypothetical protein
MFALSQSFTPRATLRAALKKALRERFQLSRASWRMATFVAAALITIATVFSAPRFDLIGWALALDEASLARLWQIHLALPYVFGLIILACLAPFYFENATQWAERIWVKFHSPRAQSQGDQR